MKVAFYKGTRPGLQGIYNRIVRLFDGGPYSHAEIVFSDGVAASSSYMDGGVRFKTIEFDPAKWDIFDLPESYSEVVCRFWFESHVGKPYDLMGNIRVVIPFWPHSKNNWHCTESIAESLGFADSDTFGPRKLYNTLFGQ